MVAAVQTASGQPQDQRPCQWCQGTQHNEHMVLCDRCNLCYHRDCARLADGT